MQKSFGIKVLILFACLVVGVLIGNGILLGIFVSQGMELSTDLSFVDFMESTENLEITKLGIGINHLILFTGSALLYWYIIKEGTIVQYFHLTSPLKWGLMTMLVVLLIASYPLIGASGMLMEYIDLPEWMKSVEADYATLIQSMFATGGILSLVLNLIVIALLPALGEELIFRGILQKELHRVIANPHLVIFITSIIFSGIHLQAEGFLPKLLISYILCYAYYWTKSLWYPLILHFINNGMMVILMYINMDELSNMEISEQTPFPWLGVIFSLFLCPYVIWQIKERYRVPISSSSQT